MARGLVSRITFIGPLAAVLLAAGWIVYAVSQSRLSTTNISDGLLLQLAEADRVHDEAAVNQLLETGWAGVTVGADKTGLNEPIMLAMLELQIELRRILGNTFKTTVPNVENDPACQVDVIEQQHIWLYAAAVATVAGAGSQSQAGPLSRFARHIACISGLQAAVLDTAMTSSFNTVALRLQQRGLGDLLPHLARFVAPLQIIILDARKHTGTQSASWRWFRRWYPELLNHIGTGGWATDRLYLWDPRQGVLTGFAACATGKAQRYCFDINMLINTIVEPRNLARGDCSFSGILANGVFWTDNGFRYTCPLNYCPDRKHWAKKAEVTDAEMAYLMKLWPGYIQEEDRKQLGEFCFSNFADRQGGYISINSCREKLYGSRANNVFENHIACRIPSAEELNAPPDENPYYYIPNDLVGVPQNPACELLSIDTEQQRPMQTECDENSACMDVSDYLKSLPESASDDYSGLLSDRALATTKFNPASQGAAALCTDQESCLTQCTALSQTVTRYSSCGRMPDEEIEDTPLEIPREQLHVRLLLTTWQPPAVGNENDDPTIEDSFFACNVGSNTVTRAATFCGLVNCEDGRPASGVGNTCSCRTEFDGNFTRELMCGKLRCSDGTLPDETCECLMPLAEPLKTTAIRALD